MSNKLLLTNLKRIEHQKGLRLVSVQLLSGRLGFLKLILLRDGSVVLVWGKVELRKNRPIDTSKKGESTR